MKLPGSVDQARANVDRAVTRSRGEIRSIMRFEIDDTIRASIPNTSKLPSLLRVDSDAMQNSSGEFYFRLGYSLLDGDHVLAP